MYGNYDFKSQLPEFDVYPGPDYWDTVKFNSSSKPVKMEIIHVLSSDYIHVCLVNTGRGTPFISAIELRILANDMYKETDFGSLNLSAQKLRYNADKYDRIWDPIIWSNSTILYTFDKVYSGIFTTIDPPSEIPQRQTDDRDAAAIWGIKSTYRITRHWQGDPPEFVWDGIGCSYNGTDSLTIVLFTQKVLSLPVDALHSAGLHYL
nr:leucine-rich repeat transmembrane protein kinase protein [Tanacetum cinerariifolium]